MDIAEYASEDATGLAELVARKAVSPRELAETARKAVEIANPAVNAVVELYPDRIDDLDESKLGSGPFRGVPFLIKDVFGHEAGRRVEFGSRLCHGMVAEADTYLAELFRAAGLNIIGRSNAPEYSMSGTTESALCGNTSNPWRQGYSAGGSTGGGMAAVMAGMVPIAHGSDIGGSIRIPASWCGGVGLKPSRGRISFGPMLDENGFGLAMNFVQTKSIRDAAKMLDCLAMPQPGDPFRIPRPEEPYAEQARRPPARLKVGWSLEPMMGVEVDPEIAGAISKTAAFLAELGHEVEEVNADFDGRAAVRSFADIWFFGFDLRVKAHSKRSGHAIGPDTLEPVVQHIYEYAKGITPERFLTAMSALNTTRRHLGRIFTRCDVWLTPTTARVAEPFGRYNLGRTDVTMENIVEELLAVPCQFTIPHNLMGTPAISLPLTMHSSGLPIGVQLAARPADEHVLLGLGGVLEEAMPWRDRVPPLHVTKLANA